MFDFLKEWRAVIALGLMMLIVLAVTATVLLPYVEAKKAVCYKIAQQFIPPIEWRWLPGESGNGCELSLNGRWFPADMVHPALKP